MNITGSNAVFAALEKGMRGTVYVSKDYTLLSRLYEYQDKQQCSVRIQSKEILKKKQIRQKVLFVTSDSLKNEIADIKSWLRAKKTAKELLVLVLDHVQDPQNLGAIFRSAALFAVDLIVLPKRRSAPMNEISVRSASGALSEVPFLYASNLSAVLKLFKEHEVWVYALDMDGQSIRTQNFSQRSAFVLGSEGSGISRLVIEESDFQIQIPTTEAVDSLNVSVTSGITCYEYRRQFPL